MEGSLIRGIEALTSDLNHKVVEVKNLITQIYEITATMKASDSKTKINNLLINAMEVLEEVEDRKNA